MRQSKSAAQLSSQSPPCLSFRPSTIPSVLLGVSSRPRQAIPPSPSDDATPCRTVPCVPLPSSRKYPETAALSPLFFPAGLVPLTHGFAILTTPQFRISEICKPSGWARSISTRSGLLGWPSRMRTFSKNTKAA
jgi:hypothetical protein